MKYMVRCLDEGHPEGDAPREVEAGSAHQAGERICGGPLEYTGHLSDLRCEVWPINKPAMKLLLIGRVDRQTRTPSRLKPMIIAADGLLSVWHKQRLARRLASAPETAEA